MMNASSRIRLCALRSSSGDRRHYPPPLFDLSLMQSQQLEAATMRTLIIARPLTLKNILYATGLSFAAERALP